MSPTRTNFNCVESPLKLLWFCFSFYFDWFRELATLFQPIRFKTKPNCVLINPVFLCFTETDLLFLLWVFLLAPYVMSLNSDWPLYFISLNSDWLHMLCPSILIGRSFTWTYSFSSLAFPSSPSAYVLTCLFICRKFAFHGLRICRIQEKIGRFTCNYRTPGLLDLLWSVWERYYKWWNEAAGFACRELNRQEARPRNSLTRRI